MMSPASGLAKSQLYHSRALSEMGSSSPKSPRRRRRTRLALVSESKPRSALASHPLRHGMKLGGTSPRLWRTDGVSRIGAGRVLIESMYCKTWLGTGQDARPLDMWAGSSTGACMALGGGAQSAAASGPVTCDGASPTDVRSVGPARFAAGEGSAIMATGFSSGSAKPEGLGWGSGSTAGSRPASGGGEAVGWRGSKAALVASGVGLAPGVGGHTTLSDGG